MAASDARPIPRKGVAYRATFPILDADGDLVTGAAGLDSEYSGDGAAFADCASEATEIAAASGMYYLDLSAAEMNYDTVAIIVKTSTSGAKTTVIVIYPEEAGDVRAAVTSIANDAITAAAIAADAVTELQAGLATAAQIGAGGAALTAVPWNAAWDAEAQSEAADALNAYDPPTKAEMDSGLAGMTAPSTAEITAALLAAAVPGSYVSGTVGARIGAIGTASVIVRSPVDEDGNVETYQGDDYNETDGRELEWSSASWPVLTSATIKIYIHKHSTILTGNVHTGGVGTQIVQLELTAAQSAAIDAGEHSYQAVATLSSGRVVTLAEGVWTSKRRYS